jgi:hypothetical protein
VQCNKDPSEQSLKRTDQRPPEKPCKDCGGASICEHNRRRSRCKDCGGASICEHNRLWWVEQVLNERKKAFHLSHPLKSYKHYIWRGKHSKLQTAGMTLMNVMSFTVP